MARTAATISGTPLEEVAREAIMKATAALAEQFARERIVSTVDVALPRWGRPSSRVTSRHLDHGRSSRVFISRSNRPYGLTCSQISGVRAA